MKLRSVLALTLAVLLMAGVPARAASEDLEKARRQARQTEEHALLGMLRSADDMRRGVEDSIARLERRINEVQEQLNRLRPEIERAEQDRERATHAVDTAAFAYEASKQRLERNALSLYATGNWTDVFTLISTADMASYASAKVYIEAVVDSNAKTVVGFREARDTLAVERKKIEEQTGAILRRRQKLEAEQQRLIKLVESKQSAANDLTEAMAARAQALAAITGDPTGFDIVVRSFGSGTNAVKMLVAAAQKGQPVEKGQRGSMWAPVQGRMSSDFGPRIHPIHKYQSNHTGIDIAAEYGTMIRAAKPGIVVDVLYLGAYGLVTIIDHGFSVATMYAHQARTHVHPGERVSQGQTIGAVGCTGWCTGPHLHFEVWSRGTPVNPLRWL